jgi:hypothetical protein
VAFLSGRVRATLGDYLFLTQRFARHANPITTVAYTHPSDEELYREDRRDLAEGVAIIVSP